jgi:hypothetical protein
MMLFQLGSNGFKFGFHGGDLVAAVIDFDDGADAWGAHVDQSVVHFLAHLEADVERTFDGGEHGAELVFYAAIGFEDFLCGSDVVADAGAFDSGRRDTDCDDGHYNYYFRPREDATLGEL